MKMEPVYYCETLTYTYQTIRCNQEDNVSSFTTVKILDFLNIFPNALLIRVCDSYIV